jgi:manganese/zinc/iron transport system substrate-binding protein
VKTFATLCLMVALPWLGGCSPESGGGSGKPVVVATTTMVADLAREIGGDRVEVKGLMGPGVDPHNYVPKLADTRLLEKADVVLYSGLHLEGKFQSTLEAMVKRGGNVVAVSDGVPAEQLLAPQEGFEGTKDPHFWGDPRLWALAVGPVVDALAKADPAGKAEYVERGESYRKALLELDGWAREEVGKVAEEKRVLVTSHDAFFYFGRAYGFQVKGLQGVSTAAEAGVKDRAELVKYLRELGVRTVFSETSINAKGIEAVAAEAGVKVSGSSLYSDALGKPGDVGEAGGVRFDRGTYLGMVRHNVNAIVEGLE